MTRIETDKHTDLSQPRTNKTNHTLAAFKSRKEKERQTDRYDAKHGKKEKKNRKGWCKEKGARLKTSEIAELHVREGGGGEKEEK